jgi:hypothetical protein
MCQGQIIEAGRLLHASAVDFMQNIAMLREALQVSSAEAHQVALEDPPAAEYMALEREVDDVAPMTLHARIALQKQNALKEASEYLLTGWEEIVAQHCSTAGGMQLSVDDDNVEGAGVEEEEEEEDPKEGEEEEDPKDEEAEEDRWVIPLSPWKESISGSPSPPLGDGDPEIAQRGPRTDLPPRNQTRSCSTSVVRHSASA